MHSQVVYDATLYPELGHLERLFKDTFDFKELDFKELEKCQYVEPWKWGQLGM